MDLVRRSLRHIAEDFHEMRVAIALGFEKCAAILSYASATKKRDVARAIAEAGQIGGNPAPRERLAS